MRPTRWLPTTREVNRARDPERPGGEAEPEPVTRFIVREATSGDGAVLAHHRVETYRDMGQLPDGTADALFAESRRWFERAIPSGEFHGWLASVALAPDEVVAGAGLRLRPIAPRVGRQPGEVSLAPEGLVINVFTERPWRRQGLGALLVGHAIDWAREHRLSGLVLHASAEGRPLYEQLGFAPTSEMRYGGEL